MDAALFKAAMSRFASGVTVLTVATPEGDHGMTASAFTSLSLDPPLVLVCVKKSNLTHGLVEARGAFAINLLSADQVSVSNRFAGWWEAGRSKWSDLELGRGPVSGAAIIGGCLASLDCTLHHRADGGDHSIFIGAVQSVALLARDKAALEPLLYFAGGYRSAGGPL